MGSVVRRVLSNGAHLLNNVAEFIKNKPVLSGVIGLIVIIGSVVLIVKAASPFGAVEGENATLSGMVAVANDTAASNGKALQFGGTTTTPTPTTPVPPTSSGKIFAAQGNGYGSTEIYSTHLQDFGYVKQAFNTVLIDPGVPQRVADAQKAGLKVILEFDYKWDFISGADISSKVQAVVNQVKANPSAIAGIYVADRLNSWANDPDGTGSRNAIDVAKMIEYLQKTGGVFHQQLPGVPVYTDVEDHTLTCDQPGQASCAQLNASTSMYRYETTEVIKTLKDTGYLDGVFVADNIADSCPTVDADSCWSPTVQRNAWRKLRQELPAPFKIIPRTSRLSFSSDTYENGGQRSAALAARQVQAAVQIPLEEGADGTDLWGWHIPWTGTDPGTRTWMNKDANGDGIKNDPATNVLWESLKSHAVKWNALAATPSQSNDTLAAASGSSRVLAAHANSALASLEGSISSSFKSFFSGNKVSAVTGTDPVIVAAGDIACRSGSSVTAVKCRQKSISDMILGLHQSSPLAGVLTLGDMQYEDGTYSEFTAPGAYNDTWGRFKDITRPVPGNHEYHTSGAAGYYQYFGSAAGPTGKGYYSYNIGKWHIVALNTEISLGSLSDPNSQLSWLSQDLKANTLPCTMAYTHHSRFSSGYHASSTGYKPIWDVLYANKADVVLGGHSHNYERFAPQNPSGGLDNANGIVQFTVGTGGSAFEAGTGRQPNSLVYNQDTFGFLKMTLRDGSYDFSFIPETGRTFTDSGQGIACHKAGSTTPTPTPTNTAPTVTAMSATPTSATIGTNVELAASASDDNGVTKVEFYDGASLLGTSTAAPFTYSWNTTGATAGAHTVKAKAYDAAGLSAEKTASVSLTSACAALPTGNGTATVQVNVPVNGTYTVWSRMKAPDSTNNSYVLQVDNSGCGSVMGDATTSAGQWTWTNYKDGNTSSKVTTTLTAGIHTLTITGREAGVMLDRIILLADTCVPTDKGYNCASDDTTPPVATISSPVSGSSLTGTTKISALAGDTGAQIDNGGVRNVVFYLDGTYVLGTATSEPYSIDWDTSKVAAGSHTLTVKATDIAGNVGTSNTVMVSINDQVNPTVAITSPINSQTVGGIVTIQPTVSDNVGIAKVEYTLDNSQLIGVATGSPYSVQWNTAQVSTGSHTITATATDYAGNQATSSGVTVNVMNDQEAPTTPTNLRAVMGTATQVNLSWTASTDDVGVTKYYVTRDGTKIGESTSTSYGDATVTKGSSYSYQVVAVDAAGRVSAASNAASITVPSDPVPPTGTITKFTFAPTDDAEISKSSLISNYGSLDHFGTDADPVLNGLIRFNVTGLGGKKVTGASLSLCTQNASDKGGNFYTADSQWAEKTVTWSNAPAAGTLIASLPNTTYKACFAINLSSYITGEGAYSLRIDSTSTDGGAYYSKEATTKTRRPVLTVQATN